ncbi:RNA recognition motif 2-domain-containing protein [Coprinopsis sp. MPI-PUGE-AT-0042]|nr:RNA recognition motif 2-domain-containing protein [Coprinopsis sp. MPI-PUGE-AT-0042]
MPSLKRLASSPATTTRRTASISSGVRESPSDSSYMTPPLTPSSSVQSYQDSDQRTDDQSTRIIMLGNINRETSKDVLYASAIDQLADALNASLNKRVDLNTILRVFDTRLLPTHGCIFLIFSDIRLARIAYQRFSKTDTLPPSFSSGNLTCQYMTVDALTEKLGYSLYNEFNDAAFYLSVSLVQHPSWPQPPTEINLQVLKDHLQSFGGLQSFTSTDLENQTGVRTFRVEYYDVNEANTAYSSIHKRVVSGMQFTVYGRPSDASPTTSSASSSSSGATETLYSSGGSSRAFSDYGGGYPFPVQQQEPKLYTPAGQQCEHCPMRGPHHHSYHATYPPTGSNNHLSAGPPIQIASPPPPPVMPHMMVHSPPMIPQTPMPFDYGYHPQLASYHPYPWTTTVDPNGNPRLMGPGGNPPFPTPFWIPTEDGRGMFTGMLPPGAMVEVPNQFVPRFQTPSAGNPAGEMGAYTSPGTHRGSADGLVDALANLSIQSQPVGAAVPYPIPGAIYTPTTPLNGRLHRATGSPSSPNSEISAKNQLKLQKIEDGSDTRTTVMIKNIPNKMSDRDLIAYINKVVPRRIDFLYLRMDFKNGANVGYAFVNFITIPDLLKFARACLGAKWNMFSSAKVLQMSYANYQGKEALVEKFKNSCIMDEIEPWRPKIFYSSGPDEGLPEPFPAPTHIKRKERSSSNRGALFVPGVHNGGQRHGGLHHPNHLHGRGHLNGDQCYARGREGGANMGGERDENHPTAREFREGGGGWLGRRGYRKASRHMGAVHG